MKLFLVFFTCFFLVIGDMRVERLKIIVFDLDYTLWPFWVDTHVTPPFRKEHNKIVDAYGSKIKCYPEANEILQKLKEQGYELGVASRTSEIQGAHQLIELLGWEKYFSYKEIFPGSKVTHFNNIKKQSNRHFDEMLFFDDESRNIHDINRIGVVSVLVRNGVTNDAIEKGIQLYVKERV